MKSQFGGFHRGLPSGEAAFRCASVKVERGKQMDVIPMSRSGFDKLKAELKQMEDVDMPALAKRIAEARAEGDLRENAEYHGARESQGMLQAKINMLRDKLSRARIMDNATMPKDEVAFGATVVVKDLDFDDEETFTLVGAGDEDYDSGKINIASPLAQGLVGKKVGDKVEIPVPKGKMRFEILEIKYES
jgi:transcription elongation factor GreA